MNELSSQHLDDTKLMILPACQASYESRYGAVASNCLEVSNCFALYLVKGMSGIYSTLVIVFIIFVSKANGPESDRKVCCQNWS